MKKIYSLGYMGHCSHDPSACLISYDTYEKKFQIHYAEEGFLSRKKKSYQFPIRAIRYCLDKENIGIEDLDIISNDFMDKKRIYRTSNNHRQLCGDFIRSRLKINKKTKFYYPPSHHYAHAIVASIASQREHGSVLITDGLGSEQQTHSVYKYTKKDGLNFIMQQRGNGIGILYTLITNDILNFDKGEEGKTMGLAAYGEKVDLKKKEIPSLKGNYRGLNVDYSHIIDRAPSAKLKLKFKKVKNKDELYDDYFTGLSYALQIEAEHCLTHLAKEIIKETNFNDFIFSGGVALNCVANSKIAEMKEVNSLYVYPASGDSGIPLGLAIAGLESLGIDVHNSDELAAKLYFPYSQDKDPLANEYKNKLYKFLDSNNIQSHNYNPDVIAELLDNNLVGALYSEGIEIGPRALGHRSFIASAGKQEMKEIMNNKIKHREGYRPFAPIIRDINFTKYFDSNVKDHPYMLQAPKCNLKAQKEVPAIVHEDKTARVQTVSKRWAIKFWEILEAYEKISGKLAIINTSFNNNNEPIVFTELDAWICFLTCNSDFLIINNKLFYREEIPNINGLHKDLKNLRNNINLKYFKECLNKITYINLNESSEDIFSFIKISANLTKSYKDQRLLQNLIDDLTSLKRNSRIVSDKYHLKVINILEKILGINIYNEFFIVKDELKELEKLRSEDYLLAYNLCGFIDETKNKDLKKINNFYKMSDTKINIESIKKYIKNTNNLLNKDIFSLISESYEHSQSSTIEEFFNQIGIYSDK